ncbi:MAG TPA: metal-dependent hydrolase [Burkholderiales bacterium]|nr:metal-dependent hydrolase [Burkholderiales bacterium]
MDTLTHALSGALAARATAPERARISAAARVGAGFLACAFPDTDVILSYISPITYLTQHRGVTHSIFLLPVWALLLAWLFAKIHRDHQVSWRDYFGVCALALGFHIAGDLITSFGTMIYAPFSDARVAWGTTFIIDLWLTGIIVAALAAAWAWRRSRAPAVVGLAVLASYIGFQAVQKERAIGFGERYAETQGFDDARVSALPRPVSPFNWMVMLTEGHRYHYANVNLARETPLAPLGTQSGLIARLNAAYAPLREAQWTTVHKYGAGPDERELAARVLAHPKLGFYRWFADYPALYRIDRDNPSICVWFEDLRFSIPGRDSNLFRYGLCSQGAPDSPNAQHRGREGAASPRPDGVSSGAPGEWRVFRLLDHGGRERLD